MKEFQYLYIRAHLIIIVIFIQSKSKIYIILGAILPDGSINWDCPCIARDLTGPCGYQMRQALACYTEGAASPECREKHLELQDCLQSHAGLYPWVNDEDGSVEKEAVRRAEDMISEAEKKS